MLTINPYSLLNLTVKEATGFYMNLQKEIKLITPARLGLSDALIAKFDADLSVLVDQVFTVRGSGHTSQMTELDKKRSNIYRRILLRLQTVLYGDDVRSLVNARQNVETYLLSRYEGSVIAMAQHDRSAVISGFVMDLNTYLSEDDIETLGIGNDINALTTANSAFIAAYNEKIQEKATFEYGVSQAKRDALREYYDRIAAIVTFYANSDNADDATRASDCQKFIGDINVVIEELKARVKARETLAANKKAANDAAAAAGPSEDDPAADDDPAPVTE